MSSSHGGSPRASSRYSGGLVSHPPVGVDVGEDGQALHGNVNEDEARFAIRAEKVAPFADDREGELRDLLATLTHELRRPSLSISGLLKVFRSDMNGTLSEDQDKTLDLLQSEAERMKRLVNRLGEMVIVEETPVLPERETMSELVASALRYHEPLRQQYGVTVDTQCTPDGQVFVSRFQLHESISNLVKNAFIHGSTDADPRVCIACDMAGGLVTLGIRDNGKGIAEKQQERIFGLFARGDTDPDRPGDGIGLAVVRRLMSRIGGSVSVQSTPGEGATFTLTFPADPA